MRGINVGRWLAGGVVAGLVFFILEGVLSMFTMERMSAALAAKGITLDMSNPVLMVWAALMSLLIGLAAVFFYVAARTRFGAGPRTAVLVGVVLFCGGYLVGLLGYHMLGLYPDDLLVIWGVQGLVETVLATLAGAWVYREDAVRSGITGTAPSH